MKKIILLSLFMLSIIAVFAQTFERARIDRTCEAKTLDHRIVRKTADTWLQKTGNFVSTDINGNAIDLDSYLNAGKYVLLDVSTTWCGYCWDLHKSHVLRKMHEIYGPQGTDELVVLYIEADPDTGLEHLKGTAPSYTYGDWTDGGTVPYPIIDDASIANVVSVSGYPTLLAMCPDGAYMDIWVPEIYDNLDPSSASQIATIIRNYFNACPTLEPNISIVAPKFGQVNSLVNFSVKLEAPESSPLTYAWTFPGGTPATSATQTESVTWNQTGGYEVSVAVTNQHGTTTKTKFIEIRDINHSFSYDFESCKDFDVDNFDPATTFDGDGFGTYVIEKIKYKNLGYTGSFMAFNPAATVPAMTGERIKPHGGEKFGACFAAYSESSAIPVQNNDWFITPRVELGDNSKFSFWAKSYTIQYGPEKFNVLISTTNNEIASFTSVSGNTPIDAPENWTEFSYDLSSYDNSAVYVAIQCVSKDAFIFMIDDIELSSVGATPESTLSVNPESLSFEADGGSAALQITSNVTWSIAKDVDWLSVSTASGSDDASVTVTALANATTVDRIGKITISADGVESKIVSVEQKENGTSILDEELLQFMIYPNPAQNELNILNLEGASVIMTNSIGQVVKEMKYIGNNEKIDTKSFEPGTYFIKLTVGENIINRRVIIVK